MADDAVKYAEIGDNLSKALLMSAASAAVEVAV